MPAVFVIAAAGGCFIKSNQWIDVVVRADLAEILVNFSAVWKVATPVGVRREGIGLLKSNTLLVDSAEHFTTNAGGTCSPVSHHTLGG